MLRGLGNRRALFCLVRPDTYALKTIHCTSADCSSADIPQTLDSAGDVGKYTSLAIGTDGYPLIGYYDVTNGDQETVHCTSVNCSTKGAARTLDTTAFTGLYSSMAIGTDGYPVVSYLNATDGDLRVAQIR